MYDAGLKRFFEFDENWTLTNEIDLSGDSPNSYGSQCYGFTVFQDSLIAISALDAVFIYDKDWAVVQKIRRPENVFPGSQPNWQIFDWSQSANSGIITPYFSENGDSRIDKEMPLAFLNFNSTSDEFSPIFFGRLHDESIYLGHGKQLPKNKPQLAANSQNRHIYRINQLEPVVYIYNEVGDLLRLIDIQQGNFEAPTSVDSNLKGMDRIHAERSNDRFMSLNAGGGLLTALYFKGVDSNNGTNNSLPRKYLSVIKDESLLLNEMEIREPLTGILKILSNGNLLFKGTPPAVDNEEIEGSGTVLYVATVVRQK